MKKNHTILLGLLFLAAVLGTLIYSSMNLKQYRVQVCITFNGQQNCRIASGVTETIACGKTPPDSVTWLDVP